MRIRSIALMLGSTALATSLLAAPSVAADYPVLRGSQVEDAPPAPESFSWEGFYFGGGAGVTDTKFAPGNGLENLARYAFRNTNLGAEQDMGAFVSALPTKQDSGSTYFGFVGYNFAFGDVILGVEADYTRSGHSYHISDYIARRSTTSDGTLNNWSMTTNQGAKLHDYATARLRMGWAYGRFMPFATIGGVVGRFDTTSTIDATWQFTRPNPLTGVMETRTASGYPVRVGASKNNVYGFGLAAGGGVDWALTDNLFLRAEYQLIRFADTEGTTTTVNTGRVAAGLKF